MYFFRTIKQEDCNGKESLRRRTHQYLSWLNVPLLNAEPLNTEHSKFLLIGIPNCGATESLEKKEILYTIKLPLTIQKITVCLQLKSQIGQKRCIIRHIILLDGGGGGP